jgi:hypothetical protein
MDGLIYAYVELLTLMVMVRKQRTLRALYCLMLAVSQLGRRVRDRGSLCSICGNKVALRRVSLRVLHFTPVSYRFDSA